MIKQIEFELTAKRRGCHLVTREILEHLPHPLPKAGLLNLFVQHTSCALSINENRRTKQAQSQACLNYALQEGGRPIGQC